MDVESLLIESRSASTGVEATRRLRWNVGELHP